MYLYVHNLSTRFILLLLDYDKNLKNYMDGDYKKQTNVSVFPISFDSSDKQLIGFNNNMEMGGEYGRLLS